MSAAVRRTAYALGAVAAVLLALVAFNTFTSSSADAAVSNPTVRSQYFTTGSSTIYCPSGYVATGGGVGVDTPASMYVSRTEPVQNGAGQPVGWKGDIRQRANGAAASGTVYVVCAQ
ncbi:hypothetical protein JK361_11605 [Streptomyces sp. 5-8]|uniref:Adenylate cyclase n=1 Tax=Streptomyces musisoli TaxID=2802280 RepID=A0ABS1NYM8_9ACTN|nr:MULTISPECIES: hypothetical protein [Streptomyces]MBL1105227.1 hypothetical protein [Streptomyces musisoli]MBY8843769.1 hypothetical protein [Streptomyces sp. SP2-10]